MTDNIDLALKYGGFTNLDRQYLTMQFAQLSKEQQRAFMTPPPSVINAYFAELYQKQGPKAATDYYFELSNALELWMEKPSFIEEKPFVRLNLSGKSYGFAYTDTKEVATVFSEEELPVTEEVFLELAQIFPQYMIYQEEKAMKMSRMTFDDRDILEEKTLENAPLTRLSVLSGEVIKLSSFNQEELLEVAKKYPGKRYYRFEQRESILYISLESDV